VTILLGGFLTSYCGYLLVPTLGPNRVLPLHDLAYGDGIAAAIHRAIDAAEANPWDCFPSGHTMMATMSALVVGKWARGWLLPSLVIVLPLIASTIFLRYHWPVDVLAGAACAWPTMLGIERLLDRDGAARV
jgi:membrane-associated phospholipid phosphatase